MTARSEISAVSQVCVNQAIDKIFCPRSIAVLGATKTPGTVPYDCFHNLLFSGYTGTLYPVSPGKKSICSVPAHRYVVDIPDEIDLAIIILPANVCDLALEQCGQKGIKSVIMISAGFREVGPAGAAREAKIKDIIAKYGISLIGPNCFGVINADPAVGMNASFSKKMPAHGRIALLSQSGGMCAAALDYAMAQNIGFTKFVSFGNKSDVSEIDLLNYLHADEQTHVIMMYLEELGTNGRALIQAARNITRGPNAKPIVAIKSGRTSQGATAASSHTGSRASDDSLVDAVFREAGIIRASTFQQLFDLASMLAYQPMPKGNRLAIITNTGGPGVLATDAAVGSGELQMAKFEPETTQKLRASVPATASVKNPVDVLGDGRAKRYEKCLELALADPNVDQAIVVLTPHSMTDVEAIAESCYTVSQKINKPIATSFMGGADVEVGVKRLCARNMPHFLMPEYAAEAMAEIQRIIKWQAGENDKPATIKVDKNAAEGILKGLSGTLADDQARAVLKAYGLPSAGCCNAAGCPMVLIGRRDATFGPVVAFCADQVAAVAFGDLALGLAPVTAGTAARMIGQVKCFNSSNNSAAHKGSVEAHALRDSLVRLSELMSDFAAIGEAELKVSAGASGGGLALVSVRLVLAN